MNPIEAEYRRLEQEALRDPEANWKRWGSYLPERQWGTVREDYSSDNEPWDHFTYEEATWRAYRWGEDGIFGERPVNYRVQFTVAFAC